MMFKKVSFSFAMIIILTTLMSCVKSSFYTVTFYVDDTIFDSYQTIEEGDTISEPTEPIKDDFDFAGWTIDDSEIIFDFNTKIEKDYILRATWVVDAQAAILEDVESFEENMYINENQLNLLSTGSINGSHINWTIDSNYILSNGMILPIDEKDDTLENSITAIFTLRDATIEKTYTIDLPEDEPINISEIKNVEYESLTTEFELPDQNLTLYFEEDGHVPYVKVSDFYALLDTGFIDNDIDMSLSTENDILKMTYSYEDVDFNETYELSCWIDPSENTIRVNNSSFFSAYLETTETNYSRHIFYDLDNELNYFEEGDEVIYDLSDYHMDISIYDGEVVVPYYIVNQLFTGDSYFNIYYNQDNLYGIYSLPSEGASEYENLKQSSVNDGELPIDLALHNFNVLAFDLDYFYGLKDIMDIDSYYDLLYTYKDSLITTNSEVIDQKIYDMIVDDLDELHTSYGFSSYYNDVDFEVSRSSYIEDYGDRFQAFYFDGVWAVDAAISVKWDYSPFYGSGSGERPYYWFLDNKTAMLTFDSFNTADIIESSTYDISTISEILDVSETVSILPQIEGGTKYFYYNYSNNDQRMLELLVKGKNASYAQTYVDALIDSGYEHINEDTDVSYKLEGYYTKEINNVNYMVLVTYDDTLDLFYIGVINETPDVFSDQWLLIPDVMGSVLSDSAVYMEMMLEEIVEEQPGVENVILDVTWNTGGNIGALFRVLGFITDEAFSISSYSRTDDTMSRIYVDIDGVPSYAYLNWSLLTSPLTFSAANELSTIFRANDLGYIIGSTSGGGTSSITPIMLPSGSAISMSSNNQNGYITGTGLEDDPYVFHHNEFGIDPDYDLITAYLYDSERLLDIIYND
ncbi:InlB B-repeat-containing protein [Mycoplasmatota bacterium]|nr:InlB B-repeat-containing protein [Mycoplasmatota bacterium]